MAKDSKSFNTDLYKLLRSRGYHPVSKDFKNDSIGAPQDADLIEFTPFGENDKKGKDKAWVSIDDSGQLTVYYDDDQNKGSFDSHGNDKSWTAFLKNLKRWAMRKQLGFKLSNKDHLGYDMKQREHHKMKEKVSEGYHAMGKAKSYNDNVPEVKIVLQHSRNIEEGEQRYRNVAKIYLENSDGERILAPTNKPGVAQIYARHLAEGGQPHDERWNHLKGLCEEYNKMAGFVRATRNGEFTESAQKLVQEGINHYNKLRESLSKMRGSRGYNAYFESWSPPLMEDDHDETINELFVQETMDPRIESVMPILSRLRKNVAEMTEVGMLESWANNIISEKLELDEYDDHKMADTKTDMAKTGDEVTPEHDEAYAALKKMAPNLYNFIRNEAPMPIDPIQTLQYLRRSGGDERQLLSMLKNHIKADTEKQYDEKHPSLAESMRHFLDKLINEGLKDTGWMDQDAAEKSPLTAKERQDAYLEKMKAATGGPAVRTAKNNPDEQIDEADADFDTRLMAAIKAKKQGKATPEELAFLKSPEAIKRLNDLSTTVAPNMKDEPSNRLAKAKADAEKPKDSGTNVDADTWGSALKGLVGLAGIGLGEDTEEMDENFINMAPQAVAEGMAKRAMADDAEKMSLEQFCDKYGDEDWVKEFYRDIHVGEDELEESEFAGKFKTGKAGQWRNKGPKANEPAKVGDLVGANESTEYNEELARMMEIARFRR